MHFLNVVRAVSGLLLFAWFAPLPMAQAQDALRTQARAAILLDFETGAVLFQKNADEPLPPASLSKLMTLAVVFKALKTGELRLDQEFQVSENAWRKGGAPSRTSAMFVPVNTRETVESLIRGIAVQSGNDASIAIAEGLSGSEQLFVQRMAQEAEAIGLTGSAFANATGLDDPDHVMTARDLAMLSRYLIRTYPEFYGFFSEKEFRYRKHRFFNRNPLLSEDLGVDGLKTGHTRASGYGLAASAVREGRRLIAVVMGLPTSLKCKTEARRLLHWGYSMLSQAVLLDDGAIVGHARVWGGVHFYVPLQAGGAVTVPVLKTNEGQVFSATIKYEGPLKPPIRKGDKVAELDITGSLGAQYNVPLYAAEGVGKGGLVRRGLDSLAILIGRYIGL
ncbi:MAG TPA: D-alanyl-D-alanine carboxypeptidase family protein [Hyphomicrobium sp.]|nr:D-alanyl-D-alanine carboxypeptidase family protein [Hyphomicrobium sp.]